MQQSIKQEQKQLTDKVQSNLDERCEMFNTTKRISPDAKTL